MVLEAVEEVGETLADALRLLDHAFVRHLRVVAGRHKPRHRWPERPHADAVFHGDHNRCSFPGRLIGFVHALCSIAPSGSGRHPLLRSDMCPAWTLTRFGVAFLGRATGHPTTSY